MELELANMYKWNSEMEIGAPDFDHIWFHSTDESRDLLNMHNKITRDIDQFLMHIKSLTDPDEEKYGVKLCNFLAQKNYQQQAYNEITNGVIEILAELNELYSMSANRQISLNILIQGECIKEMMAYWDEYFASCSELEPRSTAYMNQKFNEYYRIAVIKARKSEKALKQVQRKTYAEMLRCKAKPYDQFKESIKTNRSLFELEPMRYTQPLESKKGIQTDKSCEGAASLKSLSGSCLTRANRGKTASSQHSGMNEYNLNPHMAHAKCTEKKIKLPVNDKYEMRRKRAGENGKKAKISKRKAAIDHMSSESALKKWQKQSFSKSSSARISYQRDNCTAINKGYVNDIRKRKREDNISNNSKMINNIAVKKLKLDSTDCYKSIVTHQLSKAIRPISSSHKKRKQDLAFSKNSDMMKKGIPSKSYDKCKMKPTNISNGINIFQTPKPSLIPVYKPQTQCNWIECTVNHPIKQSKSKIPLLIHQLGSKNESNLVAHLKRIGAYKSAPNKQNPSSLYGENGLNGLL